MHRGPRPFDILNIIKTIEMLKLGSACYLKGGHISSQDSGLVEQSQKVGGKLPPAPKSVGQSRMS